MTAPLISVVIPTYNRAHRLRRALAGVQRQTCANLEIIVVDDGSTDGTAALLQGFPERRLRYVRHDENRGGSAARNTGIAQARGSYVAFLDSDDEWMHEKLERQLAVFRRHPEIAAVSTADVVCRDGRAAEIRFTDPPEGPLLPTLLRRYIGVTSSLMVKKSCLEAVGGFDEQLVRCQDWDLCIRLAERYSMVHLPDVLVRIHNHADEASITSTPETMAGYRLFLQKHGRRIAAQGSAAVAEHHLRLARAYARYGDMRRARRYFVRVMSVHRPWIPRALLHIGVSFLGPRLYDALVSARRALAMQPLRISNGDAGEVTDIR